MHRYNVGSKLSCIGAIGTIACEAGLFYPVREAYYLPTDAARVAWYNSPQHAPYSGPKYTDGPFKGAPIYHGRGLIQTTHDYNYRRVQERTGFPVYDNPDLLLEVAPACAAFAVYWADRSLHTASERMDWAAVRRGVYGGNDPKGTARITEIYNRLR